MALIEDLARASWQCVRFVVMREEVPSIDEFAARQLNLFEIRGEQIQSEADLFSALSSEMEFPDYFRPNWNALEECLRDLEWHEAEGYALVVDGAEDLWRREPRLMGAFLESWLFVAEDWARQGIPFHLLFVWCRGSHSVSKAVDA